LICGCFRASARICHRHTLTSTHPFDSQATTLQDVRQQQQQQQQQHQQQQLQSTVIVQNISANAERQDLITMFQVRVRVIVARVRVALVRAHATPCMSLTPPLPFLQCNGHVNRIYFYRNAQG
jgi:hypothetical protein